MGWLFGSSPHENTTSNENLSPAAIAAATPSSSPTGLSPEQRGRIFGRGKAATSDEQSDKELETFLNSLAAPDTKTLQPAPQPSARPSAPTPSPQQHVDPTAYDQFHPDGSTNIHPYALYPRTMSCRQAFDQAFYCQSLGGKFNDIYRFGKLQSCSEQWGAFWFCMRTRTLSGEERAAQIRDYYAGREARKMKEFGSSEDIWEIRTEGLKEAFQKDPDADVQGMVVKE